uniref:Uncharacterized protein n=2 Tax=Parascaris univalens TaxID=6257 RepID=A0A915A3A9_PARUN
MLCQWRMAFSAVHCVDHSQIMGDAPSEHEEASRLELRSLYKKIGANWREELREKCAEHLRERREEARVLNEAVVRAEINKIIREAIEAVQRSEQFEDEDLSAA